MSLFIATGSNLGDRKNNLENAINNLQKYFQLIDQSRIYESPAIIYTMQPDFFNQVLEFKKPNCSPDEIMTTLLLIENQMGRIRDIDKGPRIIDLDLIFIDDLKYQSELVTIPHPHLFERSFVVLPLSELKGFYQLKEKFPFKFDFSNSAKPIS